MSNPMNLGGFNDNSFFLNRLVCNAFTIGKKLKSEKKASDGTMKIHPQRAFLCSMPLLNIRPFMCRIDVKKETGMRHSLIPVSSIRNDYFSSSAS